jgi:hypothetical protein
MKKKIFGGLLILFVGFMNVTPVLALAHAVSIVKENDAVKQLSPDGMTILNTIDTSKSDLNNGKVAINITIDNSKPTEVIYLIDNAESTSTMKSGLIDTIKSNATSLEALTNMKQGVITTSNGELIYKPLDSKNITTSLDEIKSLAVGSVGEYDKMFEKASSEFTKTVSNKIIVAFLTNMGTKTPEEITALKNMINTYKTNGINVVVYGIDLADQTNFESIFESSTRYVLTSANLSTIAFKGNVLSTLPGLKDKIATKVSFDNYILNNFEISDVKATQGEATFDKSTNEVVWGVGDIEPNTSVTLTYTLTVKSVVDETLVNTARLRTNRQIKVLENSREIGTFPADNKIEDEECGPVIKLLPETVKNPDTGIFNYVIGGSCILAVALITLVILNNKNEFNRI